MFYSDEFGRTLLANFGLFSKNFRGSTLELQMQPQGGHNDWPAVAVITRIVDVLDAERWVYSSPQMQRIVTLNDIFPSVIEATIAQQKACASESEVFLVAL